MKNNFRVVLTTTSLLSIFLLSLPCVREASAQTDTTKRAQNTEDTSFVMQKSASGAMLRSAIIPGWGQLYNESYWKIPIIFGTAGYLVYGWVTNNDLFVKYRDLYDQSITDAEQSGNLTHKLYREFYRDQRDTYAWFFGLLYLLQIADAFVDAHLYDFNVDDTVTGSITVTPQSRLEFRLRW